MLSLHHRTIRGQILGQVGDRIAGDLHSSGGPGGAGGKACGFDLLLAEVSGQLMDNGPNHFQVPKLLGPDVRQQSLQLRVGHGKPLAEIAQRRPQLSVRPPVLQYAIGMRGASRGR